MKRILQLLAFVCLPALAFAQGGNLGSNSSPVERNIGQLVPGVSISICQPLATTAASVTSNLAVLTMASNPITAGFVAGMTIQVAGFTGGDTYFNGGTFTNGTGITSGFTVSSVTSTTITYPLTHANASATSNGTVLQQGNSTTSCAGLSTITSDPALVNTLTQPITSDAFGNWNAYATPGLYYVQFYGSGITTKLNQYAVACVPSSATGTCGVYLNGNNAWTGNETHAGTETFNSNLVETAGLTGGVVGADIRNYGATCDGTNQNTAVQSAITAGFVRIFIPKGCKWIPPSNTIAAGLEIIGENWTVSSTDQSIPGTTSMIEAANPATDFLVLGKLTILRNIATHDLFCKNNPDPAGTDKWCPVGLAVNMRNATINPSWWPYQSYWIAAGPLSGATDVPGAAILQSGTGDGLFIGMSSGASGVGLRIDQGNDTANKAMLVYDIGNTGVAEGGYHAEIDHSGATGFFANRLAANTGGVGYFVSDSATTGADFEASSTIKTGGQFFNAFHNTSTYSGDVSLYNMASGSGTFNGNFLHMQNNSVDKFIVDSTGATTSTTYKTAANCAVNSASPAACGSAASGAVVIPTMTTTYTVNTTAVTSHSRITLTWLTFASDLPSSPTCVAPSTTTMPSVSAVSAGASFTITLTSTTGQTCPMFDIEN